jgi:hypothetical protein
LEKSRLSRKGLQWKSFFAAASPPQKRLQRKARPEGGNWRERSERQFSDKGYAHISTSLNAGISTSLSSINEFYFRKLFVYLWCLIKTLGLTGFDSKIDG